MVKVVGLGFKLGALFFFQDISKLLLILTAYQFLKLVLSCSQERNCFCAPARPFLEKN